MTRNSVASTKRASPEFGEARCQYRIVRGSAINIESRSHRCWIRSTLPGDIGMGCSSFQSYSDSGMNFGC